MSRRDFDRDKRVCAMYAEGANLRQCGAAFGVSHERIRQILERCGHALRDRGSKRQQHSVKRDKLIALSRLYEDARA